MRRLARALAALVMLLSAGAAAAQTPRALDNFEDLTPWEALASDGVVGRKSSTPGVRGRALRLDFDFKAVSGYAFARRKLPIEFPANFEISFWMRAEAPVNTLEVKFTDASGENVWWRQRQNIEFPRDWTRVTIKRRQVDFAWGPTTDKTLRATQGLEFVVVRGKGGGKGFVEIDELVIRELPPDPVTPPKPQASAAEWAPDAPPQLAVDGDLKTAWLATRPSLVLDLGYVREFGGLDLHWLPRRHPRAYAVDVSEDGRTWRTVRRVSGGNGGRDPLRLPETEARYIRLDLRGSSGLYALAEIEVEPLEFGASPTAFINALAKDAPRGAYPRGFYEQPYWTLVGVDGGGESGLISEDGAIELSRGGVSVEPFVVADGRVHGWADVQITQSLQDGYLPIPSVTWRSASWELQTTAFATGRRESSQLVGRYTLRNLTDRPQRLALALAARPFQVNGPRQFLTTPGGVSPITAVGWEGDWLSVNGRRRVRPLSPPNGFSSASFDGGAEPQQFLATASSSMRQVSDETGLAAGAWIHEVDLPPRGTATFGWVAPLSGPEPPQPQQAAAAWLDAQQKQVAESWRAKLDRVGFTVPGQGRRVVDTLRTSLAHILMSRNGPILQPGTRSYDRSWIRDGAMIAESLVRLGNAEIAADYLRWYAPFQFESGKVPCCVDTRGADPTPENDSHGELIFLAAEVYRYTGDRALLRETWPRVLTAARYMDTLRASERTAKNHAPERRHLYGLLPPSISHEGYSSKPAYSHWDNFWGLLGYKDAVFIAETLGEREAAAGLARSRDEFRRDLYASLAMMRQVHGVDFIPGAADLGDFDATSTTIALAPGGEQAHLPPAQLNATFERYWREFTARRDGGKAWKDYTPYELRTIGTFVRLGWRERAHEALDFFFRDRRPEAWNGWAEVVGRDVCETRFIGDMPHAWVSSDYIRSALDLFAYDRESDGALVLAAGIPPAWLAGQGVGVRALRTPYGPLTYTARMRGDALVVTIAPGARPPGGFVAPWGGRERRIKGSGETVLRP